MISKIVKLVGSTALLFSLTTGVSMIPVKAEAEIGDGPVITPMASSKPFAINFNGTRTSDYAVFTTSAAMPWAKVYAYNTGTASMRVTITKDSPSGQVMSAFTVGPGLADETHGLLDPGTYYVSYVSTAGTLKGSSSGRIASTWQELDIN